MTAAKHTPLPWHLNGQYVASGGAKSIGREIKLSTPWVESAWDDDAEATANAAFIVEACNAHYELLAKSDAEMLRVKACEHIAEGEEGWQELRNTCPSTMAVAALRDSHDELLKALKEIAATIFHNGEYSCGTSPKHEYHESRKIAEAAILKAEAE